ncbi:ABC transporter ATP-binding protein [Zavarzinella formosa]|uniref:ABC transporter ATP-binding protein n=1 Tax=Zavarzinella formosa TaxID=360055 RepID=UPI000376B1E1|nr:ABC transporter ATP-binding protein [Zavarzinella formosa]
MRNFLRALKLALPYRGRLVLSLVCALCAALLWGLNFTAVYPVMKVLGSNMNLQQWVDVRIELIERDITEKDRETDELKARQTVVEGFGHGEARDNELHRLTDRLDRAEKHLSESRSRQWRYQQLKHHVVRHLPTGRFNTLALILLVVVIGVAVKGVFEFCQEYLVGTVTNRTILDFRNEFFRKAIHQDMRQVQEGGSADLMSRFTNDMEMTGNGMKILFGRVVAEPLRALACISIACWISWQLTLLFLFIVPAAVIIMTMASKKMKKASRKLLDKMGNIYRILQETFQGLRIVKAFTMEPYERRRFHDAAKDYAEKNMRVVRIDALTGPMVEVTGVFAVCVALLAGAYLVLSGEKRLFGIQLTANVMETETLLWLYAQLIGMADPVRKLSSVYTKLQSAAAACDRIYGVMDRVPQVQSNAEGINLERHSKEIEFQNVCFSYTPEKQVLTNICLRVKAGETIAIVGANGSGKSTLLNLLPRFYDPDHGSILIDGIDIRKAQLRSLRKQIALVSQDPILFDDTIGRNIKYGNRRATAEQIEAAAKKAFAHDFIMSKGGYDAKIGDLGGALSGGEKQRIALARAILRDPSILVLDEFSSAIDPVSDRLIHDALQEFKKGRTTFFITHKMHTVQMADRIVVLDSHELVAVGLHRDLVGTCAVYRELYEAQIHPKSEAA